ncbi:tetratricopeptide repeat protein [Arenibacterium sp. LLYu02]|uniref:tetratricopeptide repeat protein n=1 Tax=Arenibacterium sp. LLYu02 TaxID=3404132 RepID=UPI003B21A77E
MTIATPMQLDAAPLPHVDQAFATPSAPKATEHSLPQLQIVPHSAADSLPQDMADRIAIVFAAGKFSETAAVCAKLLNSFPTSATLWTTLGMCHQKRGTLNEALTCLNRATELAPQTAAPHIGMADVYIKQRRFDVADVHFEIALRLEPKNVVALNNFANFKVNSGRPDQAVPLLERATVEMPDTALLQYNLANALRSLSRHSEARAQYERALDLKPDLHEARGNLGQLLYLDQDYEAAIFQFDQLLLVNPTDDRAQAYRLHAKAMLNDFSWVAEYEQHRRHLGLRGSAVSPFTTLVMEDNPDLLRVRTQAYASTVFPPQPESTISFLRPEARPQRLKIGYFSSDFHNHATMHLLGGLLRAHDQSRFDIHAFSYGPDRQDTQRALVEANVSRFYDLRNLSDHELVERARAQELDIAIDLKGYTGNNRCAIFGQRLAPVQISYLGYPGTLGTPMMDYIITDSVVSPAGSERHFEEHLIRLPHSYQPNDNQRQIAPRQFTRADCGLPEDGFVFCCFNNGYKITPREFDIWMRLLTAVEGSVLWLMSGGAAAEANLRREAESRGVDSGRLHFAERLPHGEHLARQKVADLFLDTFAVNAHTTCSDALWAGLPVLTLPGQQFSARVAASLLSALNLPELIAKNEADYEARALKLAQEPDALLALRTAVARNRRTAPLFDTRRYTLSLEAALDTAFETWRLGQAPAHLTLSAPHGAKEQSQTTAERKTSVAAA